MIKKSKQKNIFITGGSRGIGLSMVKKFAEKGDKVYFTYLKSKKSYFKKIGILSKQNIIPIKCDMTKLSSINKLKKILGKEKKIDVLVNNVGDVVRRSSFLQSTDRLWKDTLNLNLLSAVRTTKIMVKKLLKSDNPVVINISSIASKVGGSGDSLHYGVSKSGINTFTSGLAREFKKFSFHIRVVAIAPSIVDTDFQKRHSPKARLNKIIKATPIRRIANPLEIANLAYFLSTKEAAYISGDTIFVTGGR